MRKYRLGATPFSIVSRVIQMWSRQILKDGSWLDTTVHLCGAAYRLSNLSLNHARHVLNHWQLAYSQQYIVTAQPSVPACHRLSDIYSELKMLSNSQISTRCCVPGLPIGTIMSHNFHYRSFSLMTILFDDLHLGQGWYRGTFLAISDCFSVHECLQSWQW